MYCTTYLPSKAVPCAKVTIINHCIDALYICICTVTSVLHCLLFCYVVQTVHYVVRSIVHKWSVFPCTDHCTVYSVLSRISLHSNSGLSVPGPWLSYSCNQMSQEKCFGKTSINAYMKCFNNFPMKATVKKLKRLLSNWREGFLWDTNLHLSYFSKTPGLAEPKGWECSNRLQRWCL